MAEAEVASAVAAGYVDYGMDYAIEKSVELLRLEDDQLLAKQECRPTVALAGHCLRRHDQKRSQSSRCCAKKPSCSWFAAERAQSRVVVVDRQPRGR